MKILYVFIGGGIGSVLRYLVSYFGAMIFNNQFPFATLFTNLIACLILAITLGLLSTKSIHTDWVHPILVIGFCGGFSTFSTFSSETVQLLQNGAYWAALFNVFFSVSMGIGSIILVNKIFPTS